MAITEVVGSCQKDLAGTLTRSSCVDLRKSIMARTTSWKQWTHFDIWYKAVCAAQSAALIRFSLIVVEVPYVYVSEH